MTTATLKSLDLIDPANEQYHATVGRFTVTHNPTLDPAEYCTFAVYDAEGGLRDEFLIEAEALEWAAMTEEEWAGEERSERIGELQGEVEALVSECEDEALLSRIKALLQR